MTEHQSVLLRECLELFKESRLKTFVDGTLGAGGHAAAILEQHPEIEKFIGFDQDSDAIKIAKERLKYWQSKVRIFNRNFAQIRDCISEPIDGILLDLGVSSMQLDRPDRGFSFRENAPLDMRMNSDQTLTAATIINEWPEHQIARILRDYGEIKPWRKAAQMIVEGRPIYTTHELVHKLEPALMRFKKPGLHPLTLVFQALRIAVNDELGVLEKVLPEAIQLLAPGGRLGVISFHSLEDRIVKNIFRFEASDKYDTSGIGGVFQDKNPSVKILTRKPVQPSEEEIQENPRSRSAKLRGVEKR